MRQKRALYFKDQWFQSDFRLPIKLIDYILSILDQLALGDVESIIKHESVLLLVRTSLLR